MWRKKLREEREATRRLWEREKGGREDQSFEDHERTLVELKALFFNTLYYWATGFDFNISSFLVFLDLFPSSS